MILSRQFNERLAVFGLYVGGVGDGEAAGRKAFCGNEMENIESIISRSEIVFIVGDHGAAIIRRYDLRRKKMFTGKSALARAGGADQDDERQIGKCEFLFHLFH